MNTQKGSAHIIIIIGLVILLTGALGYIFWQNAFKDKVASPSENNVSAEDKLPGKSQDEAEKLNYQDGTLSFDHPVAWSVNYDYKFEFPVWTITSQATNSEVSVFGYGDYSQLTYEQKIEELRGIDGVSDIALRKISGYDGVTYIDNRNVDYLYNSRIYVTSNGVTYGMTSSSSDDAKKTFDIIMNSLTLKNL